MKKAVGIVIQLGILEGDDESKLRLNDNITREEIAKIIYNIYNVDEDELKNYNGTYNGTNIESGKKIDCPFCYGYYYEDDYIITSEKHMQKCTNGHTVLTGKHTTNTNVCKTCGYNKKTGKVEDDKDKEVSEDDEICSSCGAEMYWAQTETLHIHMCTKNENHVDKIDGHALDSNNKCTVCGKVDKRKYESKFVDFQDKTHWAWRNVCYMASEGILKGSSNSKTGEVYLFEDDSLSAAQFVALLSRVMGYKGEEINEVSYMPDEIKGQWSEGEWKYLIRYMEKETDLNPKTVMQKLLSDNTLNSNISDDMLMENYEKAIKRKQVAYILSSFLGENPRAEELADNFEDLGGLKSEYKQAIYKLSAYDILRGELKDDKLYAKPNDYLTRVQGVALIDRFNSLLEAKEEYNLDV